MLDSIFKDPQSSFTRIRSWPCTFFFLFINDLPASLPSSVSCSLYADDLAIRSFSPSALMWRRPHKKLSFDWSADVSTGVFLSIWENVRPPFSQCIPTKLTSSPTSSYSAPTSVSTQLQPLLGSPLTTLFPFLNMYLCWRPNSFHISRHYALSLIPLGAPPRSPSLFCMKLFFGPFSLMLHPDGFLS